MSRFFFVVSSLSRCDRGGAAYVGPSCLSDGDVAIPVSLRDLQPHKFYWLVAAGPMDNKGACGFVSLSSDGDLSGGYRFLRRIRLSRWSRPSHDCRYAGPLPAMP